MKLIPDDNHYYDLQAGRLIMRDRKPFAWIVRQLDDGAREGGTPQEVDAFARAVVQRFGGTLYGESAPRRIVYRELASAVDAMRRCLAYAADPDKRRVWHPDPNHWSMMAFRHGETINAIMQLMPSGSGIDCGTTIDAEASTGEKLIFNTSYHHMTEGGSYDGWSEHRVTVRPSLIHGFTLTISGPNRNDIKEYLSQTFHAALSAEFVY